jgi:hypothetical protein
MKPYLRRILFGASEIREFVTVDADFDIGERVYLEAGHVSIDVSRHQWLLGLDPIVMGVWIDSADVAAAARQGESKLYFYGEKKGNEMDGRRGRSRERPIPEATALRSGRTGMGSAVAEMTLEFFDQLEEENGILLLLKVKRSRIRHIHPLRAWLLYRKFYKKPGFDFDRLKAYAAAFSYPRRVRIVSCEKDRDHHYLFPMDLVGDIGLAGRYLFGLRHTNVALDRILELEKMVVSEVPAAHKSVIYQLGKGHLQAPPRLDELPFPVTSTATFGFYVPEWAESYREIRIRKTINLGSHLLLWGEPVSFQQIASPCPHLYHIHFLYYLYKFYNQ